MQTKKSRSFWLINLCSWAFFYFSQAFVSPTFLAINPSQRFILIGISILSIILLTGVYHFVYRRYQFDVKSTAFTVIQCVISVLLIWGIDWVAHYCLQSPLIEGSIVKLLAIAVFIGGYNVYKFKKQAQETPVDSLKIANTPIVPVFPVNEADTEGDKIEEIKIEEPAILPINEAITEGVKTDEIKIDKPAILPINEVIIEEVKTDEIKIDKPAILPINEAITEGVKTDEIKIDKPAILPINEVIIEEVKTDEIKIEEPAILPINEAITEGVKTDEIKIDKPAILPINEVIIEEVKTDEIKIEEPAILPINEVLTEGDKIEEIKVEELAVLPINEVLTEGDKIEEIKVEEPAVLPINEAVTEGLKIEENATKTLENAPISPQLDTPEQPKLVTLAEEIETVEQYLGAEKAELGDKLNYTFDIEEEALSQKVPPIIIKMLAENAVKYGVRETEKGGYVNIQSFVYDGFLTVEIRNSGQLKDVNTPSESGIYIEKTLKKLGEMFGDNGFFSIENASEDEVVATVCVPSIVL